MKIPTPDEFNKFIDDYMCGKGKHKEAKNDYAHLHAEYEKERGGYSRGFSDAIGKVISQAKEIVKLEQELAKVKAERDSYKKSWEEEHRQHDVTSEYADNYSRALATANQLIESAEKRFKHFTKTHAREECECDSCQWIADAAKGVK